MGAGGNIWAKLESVGRRLAVEFIQDQSWLYPRRLAGGVQTEQSMHVPRKIEHHPVPHSLPRQRGSRATGQNGLVVFGGFRHDALEFFPIPRGCDTAGHFAVHAGIGGVDRAFVPASVDQL